MGDQVTHQGVDYVWIESHCLNTVIAKNAIEAIAPIRVLGHWLLEVLLAFWLDDQTN